ncbi:hypothetical protein IMX26_08730 [Clostridium sp. 'deep sea']|uniref:hypothetical protein n=1 Tax=Clostridium sp. 'deep sea' TaxID=2779445 RepID=UPI0018966ACA|nr:hypothetical protein [Clostridium sp. 'deep sea']QOR36875.1 hypothetical protein IMX26_08730 [Clostridium sp. 'deep sea']
MKKIIFLLLIVVFIGCFSACDKNTQLPAFLERINEMSNEDLLTEFHIAHAEHVCNIFADFLFKTPLDLTTETLYGFFIERMDAIDPECNLCQTWYNYNDNNLHIPISDIEKILSTYLIEYNFSPEEIKNYDKNSNSIITPTITGWGGYFTGNILSKQLIDNILTLEVEFYCDMSYPYRGIKTYTILIEENGYKFLSVTEKEKQGDSLNDQITYINSLTEKELLKYLGLELLEIHTNGKLLFNNPLELSNDMLYRIFSERESTDIKIFHDIKYWYTDHNRYYNVPFHEVKRVLDRYFCEYNFDTATYADYDPKKDLIIKRSNTAHFMLPDDSGIRGKIINRNIKDNILTLEIEFYDTKEYTLFKSVKLYDAFDKFEFLYTKVYEILLEEDGYKFLSVVEN